MSIAARRSSNSAMFGSAALQMGRPDGASSGKEATAAARTALGAAEK
jgi:hypothetical protein